MQEFNLRCDKDTRALIIGKMQRMFSSSNINVLIGSAFSMPYLKTLKDIEKRLSVAMESGMLFGKGNNFLFALLASTLMNLFFAPVMMGMHKITDTYIDMSLTQKNGATMKEAIANVDWVGFVDFIVLKTIFNCTY